MSPYPSNIFTNPLCPLWAAHHGGFSYCYLVCQGWRRLVWVVFSPLCHAYCKQSKRAVFCRSHLVCWGWRRLVQLVFSPRLTPCLLWAAHLSTVRLLLSGLSELTLLYSSSIFTTPSCPLWAAHHGGVQLSLSGLLGLTSSRLSSIFTLPYASPQKVVLCHGYYLLGLTSSHPSGIFTTPSCVLWAAHPSGVWSLLYGLSGLTSFRLSCILNTPSCPL